MTPDFRSRLADRFRKQQQFAEGYSPLYAALFGVVGDWLADDEEVAAWLVEAAQPRQPLDVTLLLAASIHREVLRGTAAALAPYFSTIHQAPLSPDTEFPAVLRATILAHRDRLAGFIQRANVQTNETGRGTVWLLPVACLGWPAVHLVELGASAGLNLVAERRGYSLIDAADPTRTLLRLGDGSPQFTLLAQGEARLPSVATSPVILSRIGGDVFPFVALGQALQQRGHTVALLANPHFANVVAQAGLSLVPLGTEEEYLAALRQPEIWHPRRGFAVIWRQLMELTPRILATLED